MVSTAGRNHKGLSSFPGRAECTKAYKFLYYELLLYVQRAIIFYIMNFCYKLTIVKTEILIAVLVVWGVSYALAKNLKHEGSI